MAVRIGTRAKAPLGTLYPPNDSPDFAHLIASARERAAVSGLTKADRGALCYPDPRVLKGSCIAKKVTCPQCLHLMRTALKLELTPEQTALLAEYE